MSMHNWYGPIKDWYQLRQSPFEYGEPEVAPGEWVLEVGLGNYELGKKLVLLVYTKLVDPGTGKVMKKANKIVYPEVADARTLFADDASGFREAFARTARKALRSNLRSLELLPKQARDGPHGRAAHISICSHANRVDSTIQNP